MIDRNDRLQAKSENRKKKIYFKIRKKYHKKTENDIFFAQSIESKAKNEEEKKNVARRKTKRKM